MRKGEKSKPTLEGIHKKVEELNNGVLPKKMKIVPYYDRSDLIGITTRTVTDTLIKGMILVAFILLAFLGDLRAALVVAFSIPLSLIFAFIVMVIRGDSANLISMGAIDFGIIVDASVVMVENIVRHLSEASPSAGDVRPAVAAAAREVVKPIIFSTAVIVTAFLPLFTMTGVEGKIFGPMAMTYGLALCGALILALTFSPALASLALKPRAGERETFLVRWIRAGYRKALRAALTQPALTLGLAMVALVAGGVMFSRLGGEFMLKLEEGNLYVRATMPNSISYSYASELANRMRAVFKKHPEVTTVISQLGRPDDGTDPTSYFNCEFVVELKPFDEWPKGRVKADLIRECEAELRQIPGVVYNFFLLYTTFRSLGDAALLLGVAPFAVTGGVLTLFITGTNFSVSSAVGFLSLFGVYVLDGVILISHIKQLREEGAPLREAVERGADLRMRLVLMTALAAAIGLLPASVATGIGSETQRPLARVVVGGIMTSAAVILLVLPTVYLLARQWLEQRRPQTGFDHPGRGDGVAES